MSPRPSDHADPTDRPRSASSARTITRFIGAGLGGALLATDLCLVFLRDCITSAQSHVLAVLLALGAALTLWGIVGGLQIDVKLKLKALGEVTAAGVAAIFLVVHFVSSDGIVAAQDCTPRDLTPEVIEVFGRVHLTGEPTKSVDAATVKVERPDGIDTTTTDGDGQFSVPVDGKVTTVKVWAHKPGYTDSTVIEVALPQTEKVVIELSQR